MHFKLSYCTGENLEKEPRIMELRNQVRCLKNAVSKCIVEKFITQNH